MHSLVKIQQTSKKYNKPKKNTTSNRLYSISKTCKLVPFKDNNGRYSCVYIIKHIRSGCFYIGVHTDNEPNSVLKTYMTSSNVVKSIMDVDGVDSFITENVIYFSTRNDANFVENLLIQSNLPKQNPYILNKMFQAVKKKKLDKDSTITDWDYQMYKAKQIKVNPKCKILDESYTYSRPKSTCVVPYMLLEHNKSSKTERMRYIEKPILIEGPAKIIKRQSMS